MSRTASRSSPSSASVSPAPSKAPTASNVFFYVPNLIGYVRVVSAIVAFHYAVSSPSRFLLFYTLSFLLDAADGYAARMLDQCSTIGAVLDMVTDRCGTAGIIVVLTHLYPQYLTAGILLIFLDIFSHWFCMYSSLYQGGASHKSSMSAANRLLGIYYNHRSVLSMVCLMNELFFIFAYAAFFYPGMGLYIWICAPVFVLKQYLSIVQLYFACKLIVNHELLLKKKNKDAN